jgi:Galactose mutarotase and related enzymes
MPMHGFARDLPFEVVEIGDTQIRMRLETTKQTRELYPFDFRFDVVYRLTGNILETTFETSSTGKASLPYYAGHHFYFSIPHQERANWQIELPCRTWGRQNPTVRHNFILPRILPPHWLTRISLTVSISISNSLWSHSPTRLTNVK